MTPGRRDANRGRHRSTFATAPTPRTVNLVRGPPAVIGSGLLRVEFAANGAEDLAWNLNVAISIRTVPEISRIQVQTTRVPLEIPIPVQSDEMMQREKAGSLLCPIFSFFGPLEKILRIIKM